MRAPWIAAVALLAVAGCDRGRSAAVAAIEPRAEGCSSEHSRFVESAGVFVRHDRTFPPPRRGDPRFEELAPDIYWYYAPG